MRDIAAITLTVSPGATSTVMLKSPSATALAMRATSTGSPPVARSTVRKTHRPKATNPTVATVKTRPSSHIMRSVVRW